MYNLSNGNLGTDGSDKLSKISTNCSSYNIANINNCKKVKYSNISVVMNLSGRASSPKYQFPVNFDLESSLIKDTFNIALSFQINNLRGVPKIISFYYVKSAIKNIWKLYVGVDKQLYINKEGKYGFNLVFDTLGRNINYNQYSTASARELVSKDNLYSSSNNLKIRDGDLELNGFNINISELFSLEQNNPNHILNSVDSNLMARLINNSKDKHNIEAEVLPNILILTNFKFKKNLTLIEGDFFINGLKIVGTFETLNTFINHINDTFISSRNAMDAEMDNNDLVLTNILGSNINIKSQGISRGYNQFSCQQFKPGRRFNLTQVGSILLTSKVLSDVFISGNNPEVFGLEHGYMPIKIPNCSDKVVIDFNDINIDDSQDLHFIVNHDKTHNYNYKTNVLKISYNNIYDFRPISTLDDPNKIQASESLYDSLDNSFKNIMLSHTSNLYQGDNFANSILESSLDDNNDDSQDENKFIKKIANNIV